MQVLWDTYEPLPVATVVAALSRTHPVAYTTAMTVLERLRQKGQVQRTKVGRSFRYRASSSAEEYVSELLSEALCDASDRPAVLVRFAGSLSVEEARVLRDALSDVGRETQP
jgi:predicted transcriptional regulator